MKNVLLFLTLILLGLNAQAQHPVRIEVKQSDTVSNSDNKNVKKVNSLPISIKVIKPRTKTLAVNKKTLNESNDSGNVNSQKKDPYPVRIDVIKSSSNSLPINKQALKRNNDSDNVIDKKNNPYPVSIKIIKNSSTSQPPANNKNLK